MTILILLVIVTSIVVYFNYLQSREEWNDMGLSKKEWNKKLKDLKSGKLKSKWWSSLYV